MTKQALTRLAELQREYEVGQRRLQELLAQEVSIRETLLRISGAIQVLQELTGEAAPPGAPDAAPAAEPAETPESGRGHGTPAPGTVLRVG
jgi:uncharacterized protein involved in exopolysaccharide biosynthesis